MASSYDITLWAKSFGATVVENINGRVTHLVAARVNSLFLYAPFFPLLSFADLFKSRTAKVKQAATKYPKIKIVSPQWLHDSIANWRKEPEEPYLITIHPEDHPMDPLNGFEEHPDAPLLSSEDEDSDEMDEEIPSSPADEINAPDMSNVGWMDVDEEFKEWIGSDDEEESENESMASVSTIKSTSSQKRAAKRSRSSTPGGSQNTHADSIMDEATDKSRNKRQRTLSDRSLEIATTSTEELPETSNAVLEGVNVGVNEEEDDDNDDDSFAAEFEREFWAAVSDEEVEEAEQEVAAKEATPSKEDIEADGKGDDGGGGNEDEKGNGDS